MTRASAALLLALLTAATLGLRARGIGFSLPHATHADARVLVDQVAALRAGEPDPEGHRLYPHLMPRVAALFGEPGERPIAADADAASHRARASGAWLRARWTAVGFSVLLVPLTYLLARALLAPGPALFAAALVGTSLLHQSFAQQERPHSALAATTALAVWLAVRLRQRPSTARYALAGLGAALAVGALHSGLAVLPALLAAHLLRRREAGRAAGWRAHLRAALPLALVLAAVPVFYPFQFDRSAGPSGEAESTASSERLGLEQQGDQSVLNLSGHFVKLEAFDGSGFAEVAGTLYSYDPALAALLVLGLASLVVRRPRRGEPFRDGLVLAAYALPYLVAIGMYGKTPERFVMPLYPFLAIVAARPLALALEGASGARLAARVAGAAALLLAGAVAWQLGSLRAADDTYTRVAHWIEAELPPAERVALLLDPNQDLPLVQTPAAAAVNAAWPWPSRWAEYLAAQPALPAGRDLRVPAFPGSRQADLARDPLGQLRRAGARYAVVELVGDGPRSGPQRAVHAVLEAGARRVHRVSPNRVDDGSADRMFIRSASWVRPMFLRVLAARSSGPTLEVYELSE